jgi:geranylgeranyl pyrophosphate synthase
VDREGGDLFAPIQSDLAHVEARLAEAAALDQPLLRGTLEAVLLTPGKRIRPALTIASGKVFRDVGASLYAMAAAVEFLHTATLIHDDVVDQADLRRGDPALYTLLGNSVAVLVGDYLFARAAATASETNNLRIMRLFAESVMVLCAGQIDECSREGDTRRWVDRETYYRTIDAKTAALFVLACHAGSILGEAGSEEAEALRRYGRSLGLAFQIVDDILDLVGDEAVMGKPAGNDLRHGVITLPVIYLREEIPEALLLQAFSGDGAAEEAIHKITVRARSSRAVDRSYREAGELAREAASALDALPRGTHRDLLVDLTSAIVRRDM